MLSPESSTTFHRRAVHNSQSSVVTSSKDDPSLLHLPLIDPTRLPYSKVPTPFTISFSFNPSSASVRTVSKSDNNSDSRFDRAPQVANPRPNPSRQKIHHLVPLAKEDLRTHPHHSQQQLGNESDLNEATLMATSSSRRLSPLPITHSRPVTPKLFQPTTRELRVQDSQEQCIPPPSPVDTDTDAPLSYSRSVTPFKPSTPTMATLSPLASPVTPTHGRHDPAQSTSILPAASPGRAKSGRRRSLWWNGTTDREKEIARVKELVRRTSMPAKSDVSDSAEEFSEFETEERDTGPGEGLTESKTTHEECAMAGGVVEPKSCAQLAVPGNRRNSSTNMKSLLEDGSAAHSSPQGRPQTPRVAAGHAKRLSPIPPGRRQPSVASTGNSLPTAVIETSSVPPAAEPPPLAAALHLEPLASQSNAVSAARERRRREMKAHTTTHPLAHVEEVSTLLGAEMDGGKRSGRSGDNSEIVVAEAEAKLAVVREVQAAHKTQAVAVDCTTDSPKYLEIISAIKEFLTAHGLSRTVQTLSGEVANTSLQNLAVTQPETRSVRDNLRDLLSLRHFVAAWNLVRPFADELRSKRLITVTDARLLESLDDLLFVLSKFQFMTLMESSEFRRANDLLCSVMRNYVSQEMAKGAEKGSFVGQDFRWLEEYHRHRSQITPFPSVPPTGNPYFFWNWESALSAFWISPPASTHPFAFYNHHLVLNSHFGIDSAVRTTKTGLAEVPERKEPPPVTSLTDAFAAVGFRREVLRTVEKIEHDCEEVIRSARLPMRQKHASQAVPSDESLKRPPAKPTREIAGDTMTERSRVGHTTQHRRPTKVGIKGGPAADVEGAGGAINESSAPDAPVHPVHRKAETAAPQTAAPTVVRRTSDAKSRGNSSRGPRSEVDDGDRGSSSSYGTYGAGSEVEKLMPPTLKDAESSDFALAATTGPAFGHIRALDVTSLPSGAIVAASAGGDDRSDRRISVWDARSGQLLTQLDNGTHKPVVALAFHPSLPNHLLAADMEFDVKLWNWEEGHIVRTWKKHHTRVIWKVAFVPGYEERAASCSGDQSIKLWDTSLDKPSISSVHANEPFTSFVFCGDTAGQTLIASLSYSIRIYKMRTLTLLHTIHLKDIKLNKTPISFISSHPLVDQVVLLSCDNQLRMFHLQSETTLRVFSSRELPSGTRIEGRFSPCGTFVYSGSWDSRTFSSTRSVGAAAAAAAAASAAAAAAGGGSLRLRDAQAWGSLGGETGCSPLDAKGDPGGGGGGGGGGAPLYGPGSGPRGSPEATGVYIWRVATAHLERAEMKAMEEGGGGRKCPVTMCRWIKAKDVSRHTGSGGGGGGGGRKVLVAAGLDRSLRTFM